ncbi:MAG: zeta toxin family protein [Deltaproteobacteria bacterium]|nr:zeta toxin family protein [Deltaproteobacteria bacterium]
MRGDVILVEEHHTRAAEKIVESILPAIEAKIQRYTITVAGESGSGKSETAQAIAETLEKRGIRCVIYQQDDYFVLPPKSNDAKRRQDISWVGTQEVKLDLLDNHLQTAILGQDNVHKPLVIYDDDKVVEEELSLEGVQVVIAEGTYTTLLEHVDTRVFIARNRLETMEARKRRAREAMEPFIERVLEIEHEIISKHREHAQIVITRDYDVEL